MSAFQYHIMLYALVSGLAAFWFFLALKKETQWAVLVPALVSLAYILPVFSGGKRLRDYSFIKIFLIALAWPWITVVLPAIELGQLEGRSLGLMLAERSAFIFAITLPFDIRDLETDRFQAVKTIPQQWGIAWSKRLAFMLLFCAGIFVLANGLWGIYTLSHSIALVLSLFLTALLISRADKQKSDYFYSGLMDGTILLQSLLLYVGERVVSWF